MPCTIIIAAQKRCGGDAKWKNDESQQYWDCLNGLKCIAFQCFKLAQHFSILKLQPNLTNFEILNLEYSKQYPTRTLINE